MSFEKDLGGSRHFWAPSERETLLETRGRACSLVSTIAEATVHSFHPGVESAFFPHFLCINKQELADNFSSTVSEILLDELLESWLFLCPHRFPTL